MDAREFEMKWMIKGVFYNRSSGVHYLDLFYPSSSSRKFRYVLPPLDMRAYFGVYHLLLCICNAREGTLCQHCLYSSLFSSFSRFLLTKYSLSLFST